MHTKSRNIIAISKLRPTQMTVGMLQVKHKRLRVRALEKRPAELVDFILEHPIRVVLGPKEKAYVIDHHHLALALMKERLETAPMDVEEDFSSLATAAFWKKMQSLDFVHPYDADGNKKTLACIPKTLELLTDDPYRSLAGFVREAGGFMKVTEPYAEFLWADYYRGHIKKKLVDKHFNKALKHATVLAKHQSAKKLPGFLISPTK
jgi:hypothetical protein